MSDAAARLLARLEAVHKTRRGWVARCPAHADREPSLSIAVADDGRVLINDFGGCATADVLAAIGLSVSDLFERRVSDAITSAERAELRERARQGDWRASLGMLDLEAKIVQIAACDVRADRKLDDADSARLALAIDRISDTRCRLAPSTQFRPKFT